jgi:hypothetical protein
MQNDKWGSRYPISGVHECIYGKEQAQMITGLARAHGVDAETVVDYGDGFWEVY